MAPLSRRPCAPAPRRHSDGTPRAASPTRDRKRPPSPCPGSAHGRAKPDPPRRGSRRPVPCVRTRRASGNSASASARSPGFACLSWSAGRCSPDGSSTFSCTSSARTIHVPGSASSSSPDGSASRGRRARVRVRPGGIGAVSISIGVVLDGPATVSDAMPHSGIGASPRYGPASTLSASVCSRAQRTRRPPVSPGRGMVTGAVRDPR